VSASGVTVVVRRTVRPEATEAFEVWLRRIIDVASTFPGHGGGEVIRPPAGRHDWVVIFRFETVAQLEAWETSDACRTMLAEAEPMTVTSTIERFSGFDFWFRPPAGAAKPPPWKMALVTLLGLYPQVLWLAPVLQDAMGDLPGPLVTLVSVGAIVVLMTWPVMPLLVRLFAPWLFGRR